MKKAAERSNGPPKATLSRRAQSYTDFHYAVRAVLDPNSKAGGKVAGKRLNDVKDDISFGDWYDSLESGLLEASHDEYKYDLRAQERCTTESLTIGATWNSLIVPKPILEVSQQILLLH